MGPDSQFVAETDGSALDVAFLSLGMAFLAVLLWLVYRTMQRPRLPVNRSDDRAPNANWAGVLRYLVTTPFMVLFWLLVFLFLLATASDSRSGEEIIIASTAVIGGARLLAHVKEELAHELAKTVPIAILGFIIIGTGFTDLTRTSDTVEEIESQLPLLDSYWLGLVLFDIVVTVVWFAVIRWRWLRDRRRVAEGRPTEGFFGRLGGRLRDIGYDEGQRVE